MRVSFAILAAAAVTLIALPWIFDLPTKLIWNASPSVPVGLYWLLPASDLRLGDLVVVTAPEALADFLSRRGYLPVGLPLLKQVAALPGQIVCRLNLTITVDGAVVGQALRVDRQGRSMPVWQGCWPVASGNVYLMNSDAPNSLDGRYFGPISRQSILGSAIPIWTSDTVSDGAGAAHLRPESPPNRPSPTTAKEQSHGPYRTFHPHAGWLRGPSQDSQP